MKAPSLTLPLPNVRPKRITLTSATVNSLRTAIETGVFPSSSRLPPEQDLVTLLGVSRVTVREALRTLAESGLIVRRRGQGTFVRGEPIVKDLSMNFGITEMIRQAGMQPGSENVSLRRETADLSLSSKLEVPEGCELFVVDGVRTANKRAAVWSLDYIRAGTVDETILRKAIQADYSLYSFLYDTMNMGIARGVAQLRPILANAAAAEKLHVRRGSPLMMITQTDYLDEERPILYSIEYHLPDLFLFEVNRRGPHGG